MVVEHNFPRSQTLDKGGFLSVSKGDMDAGLSDFEHFLEIVVRESGSTHFDDALMWLRDHGFCLIEESFKNHAEYASVAAKGLQKLAALLKEEYPHNEKDRMPDWVLDAPYLLKPRITAQSLRQ